MKNLVKKPLIFTIFMLVKTPKAWLKLDTKARFDFLGKTIQSI